MVACLGVHVSQSPLGVDYGDLDPVTGMISADEPALATTTPVTSKELVSFDGEYTLECEVARPSFPFSIPQIFRYMWASSFAIIT